MDVLSEQIRAETTTDSELIGPSGGLRVRQLPNVVLLTASSTGVTAQHASLEEAVGAAVLLATASAATLRASSAATLPPSSAAAVVLLLLLTRLLTLLLGPPSLDDKLALTRGGVRIELLIDILFVAGGMLMMVRRATGPLDRGGFGNRSFGRYLAAAAPSRGARRRRRARDTGEGGLASSALKGEVSERRRRAKRRGGSGGGKVLRRR